MDKAGQHSWRLEDGIDFIEAQFSLGDFCLDHFPTQAQFSRAIQNANNVADLRNELKPVVNLIYGERKDLTEAFTSLIFRLNSIKE
jgi:hypothetical protein